MVTQDRLKELLHYNPDTGVFTHKTNRGRSTKGAECGCSDHNGYLVTYVDYKKYPMHRLAFLYMKGEFPTNDVDHINRERDDNRWYNLREATRKENMRNKSNSISFQYDGVDYLLIDFCEKFDVRYITVSKLIRGLKSEKVINARLSRLIDRRKKKLIKGYKT